MKTRKSETHPYGGPDGRPRVTVLILGALAFLSVAWRASAQANPSSEYAVKAAFLFHFAQFAEWPASAFKDPNAPLTFCTFGEDPFRGVLDESVNGKTVDNRAIRVTHVHEIDETHACQILFFGAGERKRMPALLERLKDSPVLTVGESEHFAHEGGMIGFFIENNKIRFEINLQAAGRARLKISARLLALAKTVIGGPVGD